MALERLIDDLDLANWAPHREAEPSPFAGLAAEIRRIVEETRRQQQPQRMTLYLPDLGGFGFSNQTVIAQKTGPLTVIAGVPDAFIKIAKPFSEAIGLESCILGMANLKADPRLNDVRATTWYLVKPPVILFDRREVTLTEGWREGSITVPAYVDTVAHELCHARWPSWRESTVENAVRRWLRFGEIPHDRSPWDARIGRDAL